jgi:hypothetical protein
MAADLLPDPPATNPYVVYWQSFRLRLNRIRWNRIRSLVPPEQVFKNEHA